MHTHRRRPFRQQQPSYAVPGLAEDPLAAVQDAFGRNVFVGTILRKLGRTHLSMLEDSDLAKEWACEHSCRRCNETEDLDADHIRRHLRSWLRSHGAPVAVPEPGAPFASNLRTAASLFGLSEDDTAIVLFLAALRHGNRLRDVADSLGDLNLASTHAVISTATRLPLARVASALGTGGRLRTSGLVSLDATPTQLSGKFVLEPKVVDLLMLPDLGREGFVGALLELAPPPTVGIGDFAEREGIELARDLLAAAVSTGARGVNVLLHGATGAGKSELSRVLAREVGTRLFVVGKADSEGDSVSASERLQSLRVANQIAPQRESLLLFDEIEDLFRWELNLFSASRAAPQMSKQWFGALLEENPVPTLWCTNRVDGIDPAFLRRFTCAIELKPAGARQRARVLARHLGPEAPLPVSDVDAIARRFETSPAQLGAAVRGARLLSPAGPLDRVTIERVLAPVHKLVTGRDATLTPLFEPGGYRLDSLNCDEDLAALGEQIAAFKPAPGPGISLCLYGPPGTGKSEFVKYLAWKCGRALLYRRVSDLVSCWVGMTERNIARAFEEARQDDAVLLFDEADSFLRDRKSASQVWEVTQVNEFLQQLEAFPGIVACTTNLWRDIDEAALRRFVFKLEFHFPRAEQVLGLFRAFFPAAFEAAGEQTVAGDLRGIANLAPGDFAAVARRIRALRTEPDASAIVRMLAGEAGVKRVAPKAVGFVH
jgi:SpoVK/Ycf46/Vps4 family AAA+-type ATPase